MRSSELSAALSIIDVKIGSPSLTNLSPSFESAQDLAQYVNASILPQKVALEEVALESSLSLFAWPPKGSAIQHDLAACQAAGAVVVTGHPWVGERPAESNRQLLPGPALITRQSGNLYLPRSLVNSN